MSSFGVMFLAFVTAAVTAVGTVYVIEQKQLFRPPERAVEVTVPDLRGLSEGEARENLRALGLVYLAAPREVSSAALPGQVVRQSVPSGQRLAKSQPVTIVLADALPKVPSLLRLPQAEAAARLEQAGYRLEIGPPVADESVPAGSVVSQEPAPETPYAKDRSVMIHLAVPNAEVELPKVVGQSLKAAQTALEKLGLTVTVRWMSVAETATYVVLSQDPPPKTQVKSGSSVQLSVNR